LFGEKIHARKKFLLARRSLSAGEREAASAAMLERLYGLPAFQQARSLFLYISMPEEVQLRPLLEKCLAEGRRVAVPYLQGQAAMQAAWLPDPDSLEEGAYGIPTVAADKRELAAPGSLSLIIVPGVAFDKRGARLGMGGGFYDRFMAEHEPQALRVALAFDCQLAERLPVEPHDQYVHYVLTENRQLLCDNKMGKD
jgi:5-formyltetrahydrofolate cyclo-ligase